MDGKKIARGGVTVAETLAKYGIVGGCVLIRCGMEATGVLLKEVGNLASHFSCCSLGSGIGDFMIKKTQQTVDWSTKQVEKGSALLLKKVADTARSKLS